MKSPADCLDELQDGEFQFTITLLDHCDEVDVEQRLSSMCKAAITGNSADVRIFAVGLAHMVNDAMLKRAAAMSEASRSPDFESNIADIEREK